MPPGPGGGGGRRGARTNVREGDDNVRKFLSFYKRKNSVCVDLYLPAFYQKKPSYDDLAEFVYSVLSVGGTSSPHAPWYKTSQFLEYLLHNQLTTECK